MPLKIPTLGRLPKELWRPLISPMNRVSKRSCRAAILYKSSSRELKWVMEADMRRNSRSGILFSSFNHFRGLQFL